MFHWLEFKKNLSNIADATAESAVGIAEFADHVREEKWKHIGWIKDGGDDLLKLLRLVIQASRLHCDAVASLRRAVKEVDDAAIADELSEEAVAGSTGEMKTQMPVDWPAYRRRREREITDMNRAAAECVELAAIVKGEGLRYVETVRVGLVDPDRNILALLKAYADAARKHADAVMEMRLAILKANTKVQEGL